MANKVTLQRIPIGSPARLVAANTANDGSGSLAVLVTIPWRSTKATIGSNTVTINNWSHLSNDSTGRFVDGDKVNLLSGSGLSGIALATDYTISELAVNTSDVATFKLLDASNVELAMSATNPVFGFEINGFVNFIEIIPSQATKAAVSAKTVNIYIRGRNENYRHKVDIAVTAHIPSATVIATQFTIPVAVAYKSGDTIACAMSVYAGVQDQTDISLLGSVG